MTASTQPWVFTDLQPITREDAASGFRCEEDKLNDFFRRNAGQQSRRDENQTWVLHRPEGRPELPRVLGFYTLALARVERETLPPEVTRRLSPHPIPAILLARLARDERCKGMGIGEHLLDDAHRRALRVNALSGGLLVIVAAKNARAAAFYEAHDYTPLGLTAPGNWPQHFYVRMDTLRASYADSPR